jgi:hypothetical protein
MCGIRVELDRELWSQSRGKDWPRKMGTVLDFSGLVAGILSRKQTVYKS